MNLQDRALVAERAARAAGEMLRNHGSFQIMSKADNDYVTEMDMRSEKLIREMLLSAFPEDEFFGEESGGAKIATGRWIVDPIDGTQSFMRGQHGYTVSIAYEREGELVIGCVYAPDTDELFLGVRGAGATLNGQPIRVSTISDPRQAISHIGFGHRHKEDLEHTLSLLPTLMPCISDLRRLGSAAYALCYIASGHSDMFFELRLNLYDVAAGAVILEEAGGRITGWKPGEDYKETGNILATNGLLHDFMFEKLNPVKSSASA